MREREREGERWLKVISSEGEGSPAREEEMEKAGGMDENACPKYRQA